MQSNCRPLGQGDRCKSNGCPLTQSQDLSKLSLALIASKMQHQFQAVSLVTTSLWLGAASKVWGLGPVPWARFLALEPPLKPYGVRFLGSATMRTFHLRQSGLRSVHVLSHAVLKHSNFLLVNGMDWCKTLRTFRCN